MQPLDIAGVRARIEAIKADPARLEALRTQERIEERVARDQREIRVQRTRATSIIGERFEARTFESLRVTPANRRAVEIARRVVENPRLGAAFWGVPDTGKTHIAGAIAHACIARGVPTVMDAVSSLLRRIRSTYDGGSKITEEAMIERIASAPVLILDDLGKERLTDWSASMLWEIMNARYERNLPLIVTANSSLAALSGRYSQPINGIDAHTLPAMMRRLVEMTGRTWIEVKSDALHRPGAA